MIDLIETCSEWPFLSHLGYSLLVVKPALILLAEDDVRRLLVESDTESVKFLLDSFLVRHALSRTGQNRQHAQQCSVYIY